MVKGPAEWDVAFRRWLWVQRRSGADTRLLSTRRNVWRALGMVVAGVNAREGRSLGNGIAGLMESPLPMGLWMSRCRQSCWRNFVALRQVGRGRRRAARLLRAVTWGVRGVDAELAVVGAVSLAVAGVMRVGSRSGVLGRVWRELVSVPVADMMQGHRRLPVRACAGGMLVVAMLGMMAVEGGVVGVGPAVVGVVRVKRVQEQLVLGEVERSVVEGPGAVW